MNAQGLSKEFIETVSVDELEKGLIEKVRQEFVPHKSDIISNLKRTVTNTACIPFFYASSVSFLYIDINLENFTSIEYDLIKNGEEVRKSIDVSKILN